PKFEFRRALTGYAQPLELEEPEDEPPGDEPPEEELPEFFFCCCCCFSRSLRACSSRSRSCRASSSISVSRVELRVSSEETSPSCFFFCASRSSRWVFCVA